MSVNLLYENLLKNIDLNKNPPTKIFSDLMDGCSTVDFQWFLIT
jgi:hypothetical protein